MADQLIHAAEWYMDTKFKEGSTDKIENLNITLDGEYSEFPIFTELAKNPVVTRAGKYKGPEAQGIVKVDRIFKDDGGISVTKPTIFFWGKRDIKAWLQNTPNTDKKYSLHVFNQTDAPEVKPFTHTTVDGYAVYSINPDDKRPWTGKGKGKARVERVEIEDRPPREEVVRARETFNPDDVDLIVSQNFVPPRVESVVNTMSQDEWLAELKLKLMDMLVHIIPDVSLRPEFVSDRMMPYWARAFTHISFNYSVNYEELEKLGDAMLRAAFVDYVIRQQPTLSAGEISNISSRYISKLFQSKLSDIMGLPKYLRHSRPSVSVDMREDLTESFPGALFRIGNAIQEGLGYITVFNYVHMLFKGMESLDPSQNSKMRVEQTFAIAGWGEPVVDFNKLDGKYVATVSLTDDALRKLRAERKWTSSSRMLAEGTGKYQGVAVKNAFATADKMLESIGVDTQYRETKKMEKDLLKNISREMYTALMKKLSSMGYSYPLVEIHKGYEGAQGYAQLIGMVKMEKTRYTRQAQGKILHHIVVESETTRTDIVNSLVQAVLSL
jgi:dsRNA-specific ribonuclease